MANRGGGFHIRGEDDDVYDVDELHELYPMFFSINMHHGGSFTNNPNRMYVNGLLSFIDLVDDEKFGIYELALMTKELGYDLDVPTFYHYVEPGGDLESGIHLLAEDSHVLQLLEIIHQGNRFIDIYIEHGMSNIILVEIPSQSSVVLEEVSEVEAQMIDSKRNNPKVLALTWNESSNENNGGVECGTKHIEDDTENAAYVVDIGNSSMVTPQVPSAAIHDIGMTSSVMNAFYPFLDDNDRITNEVNDRDRDTNIGEDSDQDSDYMVDEENDMDESDIDMRDYKFMIDDEEEDETHHEAGVDDLEVLDNENFDSASDIENNIGNVRRRTLKHIKRAHANDNNFYIGQMFGNKAEVKKFLKKHTVETRRLLKIVKDDKDRVRVACAGDIPGVEKVEPVKRPKKKKVKKNQKEGDISVEGGTEIEHDRNEGGLEKKHIGGRGKKKNPKQFVCPFVLLVSRDSVTESWIVKTLIDEHKCLESRNIYHCSSTFLAQQLMEQIEDNPSIPVKAVQEQFQRKYEVSISKWTAFRAKAKAQKQLHGDYSSQYGLLRQYIDELLRTNPGTTIKLDVEPPAEPSEPTRKFKRIYICLGSLKQGFNAIGRDLVGLDGAFMKGPFPGQVLTAVGIDNNNMIYPLSYAIVEAENINSWTWFLECLGDDLQLASNSNVTFMSDRQKGIQNAVSNLFPNAEHRFCLRHIHENMRLSYKGKEYKDMLWKIASATTVVQFETCMDELKTLNSDAHVWLSKIPPKHWTRSHFSGRAHSDVLLNNMCEVFNAKIVQGRDKPIITALEYIREYLMRRIVNVLQVIDKSDGLLTPYATNQLSNIKKDAAKYSVSWNGDEHFEVSHGIDQCVVNAVQKTCSCRRWEITGIPCKHAVAANWNMASHGQQVDIPENWVHPLYKLESWKHVYSFKIFPINGRTLWPKSQVPTTITPPSYHKQAGRPKKKRKRSVSEIEDMSKGGKLSKKDASVKCGKCKGLGHNTRTCKNVAGSLGVKKGAGSSGVKKGAGSSGVKKGAGSSGVKKGAGSSGVKKGVGSRAVKNGAGAKAKSQKKSK